MNTTKYLWYQITILSFVLLLAVGGCKPALNKSVIETETVVAEKEVDCPIMGLSLGPSISVPDPELGRTLRAIFVKWRFSCDEPYFKGKGFAIEDDYTLNGIDSLPAYFEIVTDEGGVWKGNSDTKIVNNQVIFHSTLQGEGRYEGMQMTMDFVDGKINFRIIKPVITKTTQASGTETIVLDKEVNCPSIFDYSRQNVTVEDDPELGTGEWAMFVTMNYTCEEPYIKGKSRSLVDISKSRKTWNISQFTEMVTDEGGVWKGTCEGTQGSKDALPNKGKCTFIGESIYKELKMTMEWNGDNIKIRITKPAE